MKGTVYGVGVGPGDPDLLTLKAVDVIQSAEVVAYTSNLEGHSQARTIASRWLNGQRELPIPMRFDHDRRSAVNAYARAADTLRETIAMGGNVAVLCEGDPLFYGTFVHLREALLPDATCVVVPGICSINAAAACASVPLATGTDTVAVVPGTADDARIRDALTEFQTVAIIKPGTRRARITDLLHESGRAANTVYVEAATRRDERVIDDITRLAPGPGPYFSLFLTGPGKRT